MAIDEEFEKSIVKNGGGVVILAGSNSDKDHIEKVISALDEYKIPYITHISSAHKQPEETYQIVKEYNQIKGMLAYIAIAGGTDALSGMVSFHSLAPVISCPPDAPNESCLGNPPGSSNAYIAKPKNAARFIAQMFAAGNPDDFLARKLSNEIEDKRQKLMGADNDFSRRYKSI